MYLGGLRSYTVSVHDKLFYLPRGNSTRHTVGRGRSPILLKISLVGTTPQFLLPLHSTPFTGKFSTFVV